MSSENQKLHIVGICGSLRKFSYNLGLLHSFKEQCPEDISFTLADISSIPFFNQDFENPYPESVIEFKKLLDSADAVVISTPEYNLSYTGVLKNALEWISRPALGTPLAGKPVVLMGAAAISVAVSQSHLRDVMLALNMNLLNRPLVMVTNAKEKFDDKGKLIHQETNDLIGRLVHEFAHEVRKNKRN